MATDIIKATTVKILMYINVCVYEQFSNLLQSLSTSHKMEENTTANAGVCLANIDKMLNANAIQELAKQGMISCVVISEK